MAQGGAWNPACRNPWPTQESWNPRLAIDSAGRGQCARCVESVGQRDSWIKSLGRRHFCCPSPVPKLSQKPGAPSLNKPHQRLLPHRLRAAMPRGISRGSLYLTISNSPCEQHISFPRRNCARVMKLNPHHEGWAERRQAHGCSGTRRACRVRRARTRISRGRPGAERSALRPITRDARLSVSAVAICGRGPRFRLRNYPPQPVQRAPRSQVVLPGGAVPRSASRRA